MKRRMFFKIFGVAATTVTFAPSLIAAFMETPPVSGLKIHKTPSVKSDGDIIEYDGRMSIRGDVQNQKGLMEKDGMVFHFDSSGESIPIEIKLEFEQLADKWCESYNRKRVGPMVYKLFDYGTELGAAWYFINV